MDRRFTAVRIFRFFISDFHFIRNRVGNFHKRIRRIKKNRTILLMVFHADLRRVPFHFLRGLFHRHRLRIGGNALPVQTDGFHLAAEDPRSVIAVCNFFFNHHTVTENMAVFINRRAHFFPSEMLCHRHDAERIPHRVRIRRPADKKKFRRSIRPGSGPHKSKKEKRNKNPLHYSPLSLNHERSIRDGRRNNKKKKFAHQKRAPAEETLICHKRKTLAAGSRNVLFLPFSIFMLLRFSPFVIFWPSDLPFLPLLSHRPLPFFLCAFFSAFLPRAFPLPVFRILFSLFQIRPF